MRTEHRPPNVGYPPLAIMRASAKSRPCPWCHAQTGEPCRAGQGQGEALNHFVHPARMRPADSTAQQENPSENRSDPA